jgi:hypothetical protein
MREYQKHIKLKLGKFVGSGAYGKVFALKQYPSRVIKIVNANNGSINFNKVMKFLSALKAKSNTSFVNIHSFGKFKMDGEQYFYYVMPKLKRLGCSSRVMNDLYNFYYTKKMDSVPVKTKKFILNTQKVKHKYNDCHGGNLMQDKRGNYKLIDVESFVMFDWC